MSEPPHIIDDIIAAHRRREREMLDRHGLHPFDAPLPNRDPAPTPPQGFAAVWTRAERIAAAGIEHLIPHHYGQALVDAAQSDYEQMVRSRCYAADNCEMDPACPFAATCAEAESQAPAQQPVNLQTAIPEGETVSLATDLHNLAERLEPLGEEAVTKLEAVAANPATAEVFDVLHVLTGLNLDPAIISGVAAGLKTLVQIYQPEPAPAQAAQ